jgi:hypothetical protein
MPLQKEIDFSGPSVDGRDRGFRARYPSCFRFSGLFMSTGIVGITVNVPDIVIQEPLPWECRLWIPVVQPVA